MYSVFSMSHGVKTSGTCCVILQNFTMSSNLLSLRQPITPVLKLKWRCNPCWCCERIHLLVPALPLFGSEHGLKDFFYLWILKGFFSFLFLSNNSVGVQFWLQIAESVGENTVSTPSWICALIVYMGLSDALHEPVVKMFQIQAYVYIDWLISILPEKLRDDNVIGQLYWLLKWSTHSLLANMGGQALQNIAQNLIQHQSPIPRTHTHSHHYGKHHTCCQ